MLLAKLTLAGAVCLFTDLCDTLTDLGLFYERKHNIVKLSYMSMTSSIDTIQQTQLQ